MVRHNFYYQNGCISCKPCERGAANIGRNLTMICLAYVTVGLALLILPFYKKCLFCGHNMWFNRHEPDGSTPVR